MSATATMSLDRQTLSDIDVVQRDVRMQTELLYRFVAGPGAAFPTDRWTHSALLQRFAELPNDANLFANVAAECGIDLESIAPELQRAGLAELREISGDSRALQTAHLIKALETHVELDERDRETLKTIRLAQCA